MLKRLKRIWSRAQYAAMGAALGAGIGGLFSRNWASTGAAFGAMVGATYGEKRPGLGELIADVKENPREKVPSEKLPNRD